MLPPEGWSFGLRARFVAPPPRLLERRDRGLRVSETQARAAAARRAVARHLRAFGPATVAGVVRWLHLPTPLVREALEQVRADAIRLRTEEGRVLFDLRRAPRPDAGVPAPPRFLPMWDSALLAFDDRSRLLPDEYRAEVVNVQGDVRPTFLVDGRIAGLWRTNGCGV
jgi:hypothetical protein